MSGGNTNQSTQKNGQETPDGEGRRANMNTGANSWQPPTSSQNPYTNPYLQQQQQFYYYSQQQQAQQTNQYYQQNQTNYQQYYAPPQRQQYNFIPHSQGSVPNQRNSPASYTAQSNQAPIESQPSVAQIPKTLDDLNKATADSANKEVEKIKRKVGGIRLGAPVPTKPEPEPVKEEIKPSEEEPVVEEGLDEEEDADEDLEELEGVEKGKEVAEEEEEEEDDLLDDVEGATTVIELPPADPREHVNVVFIGHVDAGKSTLSGSILYWMGVVDERTIEKYKKEAKDTNRESWYLAYIMDTNEEERARGKTVEVGRAQFATEHKRFTMLDAPGHKNYVPAMIAGAAQADVGILVISARKGEFEAGFDRMGQTREHATLAKTLGVQKLFIVVNKMDDDTVKWSEERYEQIVKSLTPFLKQCGFAVKKQVVFMPISALSGDNVKSPVRKEIAPWAVGMNDGKYLVQMLDELELLGRDETAALRIPVLDKYIDRGVNIMGKIEAGFVNKDQILLVAPTNRKCKVDAVLAYVSNPDGTLEQKEVSGARVGENVVLRVSNVGEEDITKGFVLCPKLKPLKPCTTFVAQLQLIELLPHRSIFTAGYNSVLHVHTAIEECTVLKLLKEMDPNTGKPIMKMVGGTKEKPIFACPRFAKQGAVVWCRIKTENPVCVEPFADMMPLGRFTLRDEGKTIAIGKIIKVDPLKEAA